ncbi:MAG: serine/threonine dehydratase [Candidatus Binatia bacterium]|nr:MAG: serine/threonine dehydratase [Candidatus Binatia bacterium]
MPEITLADVREAAGRIAASIHRTPLLSCAGLSDAAHCQLWFKCEQFQRTGSFKFRGACNAVFSLPADALSRGVVTHSSGNHAQAVARAARLRGAPAFVVMPRNSARCKEEATRAYGAEVLHCAATMADRERVAAEVQRRTGAHLIHPYDDPRVIAGQGTVGLELLEQLPDVDIVVVPVGGGGLASGVSVAIHALKPTVRIFAAEPEGAGDAAQSLRSGILQRCDRPVTIADGLRAQLSERTFGILRAHLDSVVLVPEEAIVRAMRQLWERTKWLVEPSAAVAFAALFQPPLDRIRRGQRVVVILTGGNVDLDRLPWNEGPLTAAGNNLTQ